MDVLDNLHKYKQEVIGEALRTNNAGVLMDPKWLLKRLGEFGIYDLPLNYPLQSIRQLLLNVDTVCGTRGSKIGIELYCSVLSLGEVTLDDSGFYNDPKALLLDSLTQGFITQDNSKPIFHVVSDNSIINPLATMSITIKSKFFNGEHPTESQLIQDYLKSTINNQLGFSPNKTVTFVFQNNSDFYFHKLLNPYFV